MDVGTLVTGAVLALAGAVIGYGFRVREAIRSERAEAYSDYVSAVDALPYAAMDWVAVVDPADAESVTKATEALQDLRREKLRSSARVWLVGSPRVVTSLHTTEAASTRAIGAFTLDLLLGPGGPLERQLRFYDRYQDAVWPLRNELVVRMRKDLQWRGGLRETGQPPPAGVDPRAAAETSE